jgi:hypothetical protein
VIVGEQRPANPATLHALLDTELSLRSRLGYVALLLAALMMTSVIASFWMTEPALPARTQVAFAAMVVIGLSWVGFALWVLTHRRVLLAPHSVVAGRMAVTCTGAFVIGALVLGYAEGSRGAFAAAAMGVGMLGAAAALLVRAHHRLDRLAERRRELDRELHFGP